MNIKAAQMKSVTPTLPPPVVQIAMSTPTPTLFIRPPSTPTATLRPTKAPVKRTASKTTSSSSSTTPSGPRVPGIPVKIEIPKLGINASVEQVGLNPDNSMAEPKSWWSVGWYNLGYKIGEPGSAVMSGHYDTNTGAPAIFYRIKNLAPGDIITVRNADGSVFKFKVTGKQNYPYDQLPMQSIFASFGKAGLNLITCSGTWNRGSRNYSQRTVVYSELIN